MYLIVPAAKQTNDKNKSVETDWKSKKRDIFLKA